jgi:hypothetical protein
MRNARRSTSFKYTTWNPAMQCNVVGLSCRFVLKVVRKKIVYVGLFYWLYFVDKNTVLSGTP